MTTRLPVRPALAVLLLLAAGCGPSAPPPAPPPAPAAWTPERIAQDPAGYLDHAGSQIEAQIAEREQRLQELAARRAELATRDQSVQTSFEDVRNLHDRLTTAMRRAADEDRWPMKFAGQTFTRERAEAVAEAARRYVEDRSPLASAYADAFRRLDQAAAGLKNDIERLRRLQEKIALDRERVRINQGLAQLEDLRKTEAELALFTKSLADSTDDPLADAALRDQGAVKSAADFLKE